MRFPTLALYASLAALPLSVSAITLTGTVRDFSSAHADFEKDIGGLQPGQLLSTLGADGKPVYNTAFNLPGFHGADSFNQWYRDVAGVNQSAPLSIDLNPIGGGVYEYSNSSFFPIDNS